jgi:hypothetical protein
VGTSATKIATAGTLGVYVQNMSTTVCTLGGPSVVAGQGPSLASNATPGPDRALLPGGRPVDSIGAAEVTADLYGIVASGSASVAYLVGS